MAEQPGIVSPMNYKIRDPKDPNQSNGQIFNPVRFGDFGGLTDAGKWPKGNDMKVEAPTTVKTATPAAKRI